MSGRQKFYPTKIDIKTLDAEALKVLKKLRSAGFKAYIVGGAVRDLLLGGKPKDFDIATDAKPEQVKSLFRKAFIIGRRFRIVLVVFFPPKVTPPEVKRLEVKRIEVTTFRAHIDFSQQVIPENEIEPAYVNDDGMILRDNVYGNLESDAQVRDFTINALYLEPFDQKIIDFGSGMEDLGAKKIRLIGDPATRFREDPVRILRSLRFMAKLRTYQFHLHEDICEPLLASMPLLKGVSEQRLLEESYKFFIRGYAQDSMDVLASLPLLVGELPALMQLVLARMHLTYFYQGLKNMDGLTAKGQELSSVYLLALCFWEDLIIFMQSEIKEKLTDGQSFQVFQLAISH
ncbi:MAG: polynucleotide adenylyltransferase PcnB, partial [Gammaproteobacteria bacterium]|nr:polynucleotide adenylyltransferase PcnB [Gammaproteobacteria bacterium]